jgi:hypothetical protein
MLLNIGVGGDMVLREKMVEAGRGMGAAKIKGAEGQEPNNIGIAKMISRGREEGMQALSLMRKNQKALAYVAALHPEKGLREKALSMITEDYPLMLVSRSSPYPSSVVESLNELGRRLDSIGLNECLEVALRSSHREDRFDAFQRLKEGLASGKVVFVSGGTFRDVFSDLAREDNVEVMRVIRDLKGLEKEAIGSPPYSADDVAVREDRYSEEGLLAILEGSRSTG